LVHPHSHSIRKDGSRKDGVGLTLTFHRVDRLVRRDSTFLLHGQFFEAPPHLAGQRIEVRFDPLDQAHVEIYHGGQLAGAARLVDAVVNGRTYR
jgi:hypothetical protein